MKKSVIVKAIIYAILAAIFYAISIPSSKLLMDNISPTMMAAFLYLGAGVGVGAMYCFHHKKEATEEKLIKKDLPYVIGMIILDIAAPILLMLGVKLGKAANASLLGNFEIVATSLIALFIFKEKISKQLWIAILIITISSAILSFESSSFQFSYGSLLVIAATICWGFENNCTRKISSKSTYQIVILKGIFSGLGSLIISFVIKDNLVEFKYLLMAMAIGFVAYGLSIFMYIKAQRYLGAAKTSSFYALAPFVGTFLSFVLIGEELTVFYYIGLALMIIGSIIVVLDILKAKESITNK